VLYGGSVGIEITRPEYHLGRIPASKGKTYSVEILTPDEVRALLAQCSQTSSYGIRHRALIVMLYRTGLRCGEVLALYVKDIDFQGRRSHGAGEFSASFARAIQGFPGGLPVELPPSGVVSPAYLQ
jgi:hypothetical protein